MYLTTLLIAVYSCSGMAISTTLVPGQYRVAGFHGVGAPPGLDSFTFPTASRPFLISLVSSPGSWFQNYKEKGLDEKRKRDALFDDYGIAVGLMIAPR